MTDSDGNIYLKRIGCMGMLFLIWGLLIQTGITVYANEYKTVKIGYYQAKGFQEEDDKDSIRSGYGYEYM